MSSEEIESSFNAVLFYLQLCLGIWQFIKLTPVGGLIKGGIEWLLRPLGVSRTYSLLHACPGRVFKKANCFVLQAEIPAERRDIESVRVNSLNLEYLGKTFVLEREEGNNSMSFVGQGSKEIKYYITDMIWEELQNLKQVLSYGSDGPPFARAAVTSAAAERAEADAKDQEINVQRLKAEAQRIETAKQRIKTDGTAAQCDSAYYNVTYGVPAEAATDARAAAANSTLTARKYVDRAAAILARASEHAAISSSSAPARAAAARAAARKARAAAAQAKKAAASRTTLFVKGKREFWKEIITGGVMTFEEVMDAIILYNQHVSVRLSNDLLLPINLSVSEEKLLKILNLVALFLQIKKVVKVHWSIPFSLSCISALLEFTTTIRVRLYSKINMLFCYVMHLICDPLPRPWRRQIYSLGNWVENLTPSNDIQLKVVRGTMCAIITEGAKIAEGAEVDKEGANVVGVLGPPPTPLYGVIEQQFPCEPLKGDINCTFVIEHKLCQISAPTFPVFYVKCNEEEEFKKIITLVSCIAHHHCGSLISYGPNDKVRVRGFEKSVTSYVDSGLPSVYTLGLQNVIAA